MKKILVIIFILLPTLFASAQGTDVSIKVNPVLPEPGQRAYLTLESFSTNLGSSNIRWYAKDRLIKDGVGVTSINFVVPDEAITIVAQIITPEAEEIIKNITIYGSVSDILWEAPDTYTPPFYKGKGLPGPESLVKFVGLPSSASSFNSLKDIDFVWSKNGEVSGSSGGKGKDSYSILLDSTKKSETISLTTSGFGQKSTNDTIFKPFKMGVSVYPLSSGGEPFIARSLRNGDIVNREISFFAAPYGAHSRYLNNTNISYSWNISSSYSSPSSRPFLITIIPSNQDDQSLGIEYNVAKSLFEGISRIFQIKI